MDSESSSVKPDDLWLERWLAVLRTLSPTHDVLELGCGSGRDTKYLVEQGFTVTATDIARDALKACAQKAPTAECLEVDVRRPLPFNDRSYHAVVASLCLHYFLREQTLAILGEIRRCLKQDGLLLSRFNSTNDVNFGAVGFREIEPNFYAVRGRSKRFFDRKTLQETFADGWEIRSIEEMTILRYSRPKVVWEVIAQLEPPVGY